jgi:pectate lyase
MQMIDPSLKFTRRLLAMVSAGALAAGASAAEVPAFPGAEGHGAQTSGGRGGKVWLVTNLNDSGPGSLREAVEAKDPRIVVFQVSGTIALKRGLGIRNPNITIAGQTAPGDGICLKDHPLGIAADNVVVRYLRVRLGDESGQNSDAISSRFFKNIILDHLSASWSIDETVSVYHCENVTVQWCLISESLYGSGHSKGTHGFGAIWGSNHSTYHHNLLAHHSSRVPRLASGSGFTDIRNNVFYNWGYNSTYGGEKQQVGNPKFSFSSINLVANYYKPGPATAAGPVSHRIANPSARGDKDFGEWYVADNHVAGNPKVTADNWDGGVQLQNKESPSRVRVNKPWPAIPIKQETAEEAYLSVLDHAGANLPKRDPIDIRVIEETRKGTATYEGTTYRSVKMKGASKVTGIVDSQKDVGGWPELKSAPAPIDTDSDGMPDDWEIEHGLDPKNPADNALDPDKDGYTNIEEFLNRTYPKDFVDYTKPENNVNTLHGKSD